MSTRVIAGRNRYAIPEEKGKNIWEQIKSAFTTGGFDVPFLVMVTLLTVIGLLMMYSASYEYSRVHNGGPAAIFLKQLYIAVPSYALMIVISKVNLDFVKKCANIVLLVAVGLLVLCYVLNIGKDIKRHIDIGPIQFQPSDIAKFALILYFAYAMDKYQKPGYLNASKHGTAFLQETNKWERFMVRWRPTLVYCGVLVLIDGLVVIESHLSATIIILGIGAMMMFIGEQRIPGWVYFLGIAVAVVVIVVVISNPDILLKFGLKQYQVDRITAFKNPLEGDLSGDKWQTANSLMAIGSGGLFGRGLGKSVQKLLYLPEPQNDFIFAIVCEELGFVGAMLILLLFAALVFRGFLIALHSKDRFAALLTMGIMIQLALQTILNIGVVTALLPNTGILLPFFSQGGTAIAMLLGEMGLVLAVSRQAREVKL
ncbi:MAG: putative lipid II flippase FtsW [Oscillospiraceae bacterium]|jgi:cell division protein FtsW|nr:putative lipid II flippase FtsW [Oscillospiraceae bacterium]